ncbi:MAG TPA: hypothetical protein EYH46_04040 [Sulfurivirga caldicuralii]|nr:hypothetical protein [Sulfurivirga caldicuralii]
MSRDIVYATRDAHGLIEVRESYSGAIRTLHFGNDIEQSRYDLNAPFTLGFEYLQVGFDRLMAIQPATLLSLGLGGGRLNTQLLYALPHCRQTVVELRPAVIHIAREWFHLPEAANLAVVQGDAFEYISTCRKHFDAIFIDLYDGQGMPPIFATPAFFEEVLRCTTTILINIWQSDNAFKALLRSWLVQQPHLTLKRHRIQSSPNWLMEITVNGATNPA